MQPTYFATPAHFRRWLEAHHTTERELLVGFYKKGSGRPSITWPESVDQALCFGWIDGVRKRVSDEAYTIRFTPRKTTSIWSSINVARVGALQKLGLMSPAGVKAFAARKAERTGVYSFEREAAAVLEPEQEAKFRANAAASQFFDAQAAWYRRTSLHWVVSAKREETRERRLQLLILDCSEGRTLAHLTRVPAPKVGEGKGAGAKAQTAVEKKASKKKR